MKIEIFYKKERNPQIEEIDGIFFNKDNGLYLTISMNGKEIPVGGGISHIYLNGDRIYDLRSMKI